MSALSGGFCLTEASGAGGSGKGERYALPPKEEAPAVGSQSTSAHGHFIELSTRRRELHAAQAQQKHDRVLDVALSALTRRHGGFLPNMLCSCKLMSVMQLHHSARDERLRLIRWQLEQRALVQREPPEGKELRARVLEHAHMDRVLARGPHVLQ